MWYLVEILFAQPQQPGRDLDQCESCNVVFQAETAVQAYGKAIAWGQSYAAKPPATVDLLGVSHLTTIGKELGDGVEICGRFFEEADVWGRVEQLIPPPERLKAILWEGSRDVPVRELLSAEQLAQLKRVWGEKAGPGAGATRSGDG
jgi:hypothetical protein